MKTNRKNKNEAGFTLIEIMLVVSIISFIASIMMVAFHDARTKGQLAKWQSDTAQIQKAYELYYEDHGYYPYALGEVPAEALSEYLKVVPTTFTAGVGSYFALSRTFTDPDSVAISDDRSGCVKIHDGYVLAVGAGEVNALTIADGGIEPMYYEAYGGDYKIYTSGVPGTFPDYGSCPDY